MSEFEPGGSGFSGPGAQEPVGSVGEEAAKLLAALQDWAHEHIGDEPGGGEEDLGGARGAGGFGSAYISDGSAACRVCPVCQLIAFARGVNPESLDQLGHAAGTMLHALADLVDGSGRSRSREGAPVQKIDLIDDPEDPTWR